MAALVDSGVDVEQLKTKFIFLRDVPYVEMANLTPFNDECYVCLEPFNSSPWQLEGTLNRPVRLPCGHIIGIQCLARWALSANFDNRCSLCRVKVIDTSRVPITDRNSGCALMILETLAVFEGSISSARKERLLDIYRKGKWGPRRKGRRVLLDADRLMMLYEEFVGYLGKNRPAIQQRTIVQPVIAWRPILRYLTPEYIITAIMLFMILFLGIVLIWDAHIGPYQGSQRSARTGSPNGRDVFLNGPTARTRIYSYQGFSQTMCWNLMTA